MNKLSLIISGVLLCLIGYVLYETQQLKGQLNQSDGPIEVVEKLEEGSSDLSLAFVRGDSIMLNYQFVQVEQELLVQKAQRSESKLKRGLKKAEDEYQGLVQFVNTAGATESDAQAAQQRIMELEYQLNEMQQVEQSKIARIESDFQNELYARITVYLKKYASENGIHMVFNREPGGQTLLYSDDMLDVTEAVVAGLNAEYELEMAPAGE